MKMVKTVNKFSKQTYKLTTNRTSFFKSHTNGQKVEKVFKQIVKIVTKSKKVVLKNHKNGQQVETVFKKIVKIVKKSKSCFENS